MVKTYYYIILFAFLTPFILGSCKISKAFDSLEVYDYFNSKKQFEKSLKRNTSPAAYGLSMIYFRNDNPFHNLDSAYHYSLLSVEVYTISSLKKKQKWKDKLNYTIEKAIEHRELISDFGFEQAVKENTVDGYLFFMKKYPWSKKLDNAIMNMDSLAFLLAQKEGTSTAYAEFIQKYADSKWITKAQDLLYSAQYNEIVKPQNTESYMEFIRKFPTNPHVEEAQYKVFVLETKDNSLPNYIRFIKRFPTSPFIGEVWKKFYRLSIADYKRESIEKFQKEYPDFPFPELIHRDLQLSEQTLFQFVKNDKYGFMDESGRVLIAPTFEYAGQFKNGLAIAIKDEKYGYINKYGELKINYQFDDALDFNLGRAVVEVDGLYGLIDVAGNFILQPIYEDIGPFSNGLAYVQDTNGFQYYNLDGKPAFSTIYDEAFSFNNGFARVRKDDKIGFITPDGNPTVYDENFSFTDGVGKDDKRGFITPENDFYISVSNGDLRHFNDNLFIHEFRDSANIIFPNGKYLYDKSFERIGVLSDNRAIAVKDGVYGYIDGSGKVVVPLKFIPFSNYMEFAQFKNNHAVYKQGEKYAMIDSLGIKILPALFSGIGIYGELIPVIKDKKWGYSDKNVQLKINYQYSYAYEFVNGVAIVENNGFFGLIDLSGNTIEPLKYESIKRMNNELLLFQLDSQYGIFSSKGEQLVQPQYQKIIEISEGLYQLIKGNKIAYYDVLKDHIIELKE